MGTTIRVTKLERGGLRAVVKKANDQPDAGRSFHDFEYKSITLDIDPDGTRIMAPVIIPVESDGQPPETGIGAARRQPLTGPEHVFQDAFLEAIAKKPERIRLTRDGVEGPEVVAVDLATVREEFNRRCARPNECIGEADRCPHYAASAD